MKSEIDSFQYFSVMERGASHKEKNMPLQDFASSCQGVCLDKEGREVKYVIASISDGHGNPRHFRSDRGAKLACKAVEQVFLTVMQNVSNLSENNKEIIQKKIYTEWRELVREDISENLPEKKELANISEEETKNTLWNLIKTLRDYKYSYNEFKEVVRKLKEYEQAKRQLQDFENPFRDEEEMQGYKINFDKINTALNSLLTAYGCTLISVLSCDKYTFAVQIGDGSCVAFYKDGSCNIPVPEEGKNMANITTSLCRQNPEECRIYVFEERPVAVFVASDGIDDSYGQGETLFNFYRRLCLYFLEKGIGFKDDLQAALGKISSDGSKDDISISGIYDEYKLKKLESVIAKRRRKGIYEARLAEFKDTKNDYNFNALKTKVHDMKNEKTKRENEISDLKRENEKNSNLFNRLREWLLDKLQLCKFDEARLEKFLITKEKEIDTINKQLDHKYKELDDLLEAINEIEENRQTLLNEIKEVLDNHKKLKNTKKEIKETSQKIKELTEENNRQNERYLKFSQMYNELQIKMQNDEIAAESAKSKIGELDEEIKNLLNDLLNDMEDIKNHEICEEPQKPESEDIYDSREQENRVSAIDRAVQEVENSENYELIKGKIAGIKLKKETPQANPAGYYEENLTDSEQTIGEQRRQTNIDVD